MTWKTEVALFLLAALIAFDIWLEMYWAAAFIFSYAVFKLLALSSHAEWRWKK